MAIHSGEILAGYRVKRLLGRGGMGEVWAAESQGPPPRVEVAIKVLLPRAALKPDLVRRFDREARIAATLKSPYVCELIEVAEGEGGVPLLVFEHLTGETLADRLKREQYLPFGEVAQIIDDVLQGLCAAHAAGVIHRDLKPGNIFLVDQAAGHASPAGHTGETTVTGRHERAKILDFGISKLRPEAGQHEPTLTDFNATLGSFAYMAPEQVRGAARADERADIYAVGAVAFRSLSGRLPFDGSTAAMLVALKLEKNAPSLADATGDHWPAGIERFLERALARSPDDRFPTAVEALEGWRAMQRGPSRPAFDPIFQDPGTGDPTPILPVEDRIESRHGTDRPSPPPAAELRPSGPPSSSMPPASSDPRRPPLPRIGPSSPRGGKGASAIPAPTKPVITVYNATGAAPRPLAVPRVVPGIDPQAAPPTRALQEVYRPAEDNPTEVDGPPTMTLDGSEIEEIAPKPRAAPPASPEATHRRGRP